MGDQDAQKDVEKSNDALTGGGGGEDPYNLYRAKARNEPSRVRGNNKIIIIINTMSKGPRGRAYNIIYVICQYELCTHTHINII